METLEPSTIEWGVASRALAGQPSSGDLNVVKSFPNGVLVAALDGIGHGEEAASAALVAKTILEAHPEESVIELIGRCHEGLRATRGVAMSVASFNLSEALITWVGVGNVEAVLLRPGLAGAPAEESLLLRAAGGGAHVPSPPADVFPLSVGHPLILSTHALRIGLTPQLPPHHPP